MNGIEKIIETITAEAAQKEAQILAAASKQADDITERYADIITSRSAQLQQEAEDKSAQVRQRMITNAELEARKRLLQAKQDLINQAFSQTVETIKAYPQEQLVELLAKLAIQAADSGREELIFAAGPRDAYGAQVVEAANQALTAQGKNANLTLSSEVRNIDLGLVVKDGPAEISCIIERLVWDQREALAMEVAAILFAK